ncbi:MAG: hypothetical protein Q9225_006427 [Loekoesia sp. 1 TL-2023]
MRGFEWKDQRGVEGIGFVRALRSLMTAQLPTLLPSLRCTLEKEIVNELHQSRAVNGCCGYILNVQTNRTAQDSEFTKAALQYPQDVFVAGEVIRSLPQFLASYAS